MSFPGVRIALEAMVPIVGPVFSFRVGLVGGLAKAASSDAELVSEYAARSAVQGQKMGSEQLFATRPGISFQQRTGAHRSTLSDGAEA